jgi:hypothetical protein
MKLRNLYEQNEITLSSTEKYILLAIHTSQTPVLAFDRIRDSQRDVIASNMLNRYGFIKLFNGSVQLTERGSQALTSYGLVDETGEVTEIGQELMDNYDPE